MVSEPQGPRATSAFLGAVPDLLSNAEFKAEMLAGSPKLGYNLSLGSNILAELISYEGLDWVMVDMQHAPSDQFRLGSMFQAIQLGGAKSCVRVGGAFDTAGIQQALDMGCDCIMVRTISQGSFSRTRYAPTLAFVERVLPLSTVLSTCFRGFALLACACALPISLLLFIHITKRESFRPP